MILAALIAFPIIKLQYSPQISFSKESGYYDSQFYLTISGGGNNTIHFTLDGSEPTIDDPVYDRKNPIYIEDATNHANVYSTRTDTSTGFLTDLIGQYSESVPYYMVPNYNVDKCTIIRASLFDETGNQLDSITGTYFVGFDRKKAYQNIYTASIVTSPENLFDDDIGIYVTGNTFTQYWKEEFDIDDMQFDHYWWWWTSNYSNSGIEWERDADIAIFDNHQNTIFSEKCGIRIKGGKSRGQLPRSISCYARDSYEGRDYFQTDIFQTNTFPHKIVFFAGGDDNCFKIKDYLVHVMEQDLNIATMDFIPCALFLDGEYWGMYYITEDYNAKYIHDHYHVANDNIIMVKNYRLSEGNEEDYHKYEEMRTFIREHDMSDTENYNHACNLIDINSYIDYYAAQIYIARNVDWPSYNIALWRTREDDGSIYGDTKWRWMLFDVNSGGLDSSLLFENTLANVLESDDIFSSLYQNEEFRLKFAKRLLYIGKEIFNPQKCNTFLDDYTQELKEPIASSNMRFYMDPKYDEFENTINDLKTFFAGRYDAIWNFLTDNMGEEWLLENGIQK